jgi:preprotein translocase subunit SecY
MFGGILSFAMYVVMYVLIIVLVVFMQLAVRKIPIQYTSSNMHRGKNDITYLPLKINSAGVMPVIFSSAIMTAPLTIMSFFPANDFSTFLNNVLNMQKPLGLCIYAVLIVLFTFFYTNLQVDPEKIAENLGKSGTYIPGIRPGAETKAYLAKVLNRITVLGAAFILFIAILPYLMTMFTNLTQSAALGGTGIIIVVGVATETFSALKGMLTQKQYRGFIQR